MNDMDKEVKRKPHKCPYCGGKVVEIVYGMPSHELLEEEEKGNIVLGGCCITVDDDGNIMGPQWRCTKCGTNFIKSKEL